jgi:hypothetical protein
MTGSSWLPLPLGRAEAGVHTFRYKQSSLPQEARTGHGAISRSKHAGWATRWHRGLDEEFKLGRWGVDGFELPGGWAEVHTHTHAPCTHLPT